MGRPRRQRLSCRLAGEAHQPKADMSSQSCSAWLGQGCCVWSNLCPPVLEQIHRMLCARAAGFSDRSEYVLVTQLCPTLFDPMDCGPPGFSVHGILQARILEWVTISSPKGSFPPRSQIWVSCITGRFFTDWVKRESQTDLLEESARFLMKGTLVLQARYYWAYSQSTSIFLCRALGMPHSWDLRSEPQKVRTKERD